MAFRVLRRIVVSVAFAKHEPQNLTNFAHFCLVPSPFLFSTKAETFSSKIAEHLMNRHHLCSEAALNAASVLNSRKNYKNIDSILDYFKEIGLSNAQLEDLLLSDPRFLGYNFDRSIKPKIQAVQELGFSPYELVDLLSSVPTVYTVHRDPARLVSCIHVLLSLLDCNVEVIKLLRVCDWFLSNDLEKSMSSNIELMKSCGISLLQMRQLVFSFPRFFMLKNEFLNDCVKRVDEMGLSRTSKMYIHGLRAVSSMSLEKWGSKLGLLRNLGFTDEDILSVFRRTPQIFAISDRKIKEVTQLMFTLGNADVSYVVQHPELLIYSAKHRIGPRLQIMGILQSKKLLIKEPSLTSVCKMVDDSFIQKFVIPYASDIGEVGEKYMARRGSGLHNAIISQ